MSYIELGKPLNHFLFSFPLAIDVKVEHLSEFNFTRKEVVSYYKNKYKDSPAEKAFYLTRAEKIPTKGHAVVSKDHGFIKGGILFSGNGVSIFQVEDILEMLFAMPSCQQTLSRKCKESADAGMDVWLLNSKEQMRVDVPDSYWKDSLSKQREDDYLVIRLIHCIKGHYLEDCFNNKKIPTRKGVLEFSDSKRPYGNKDVEASIAFNLGWDWAGVLHSVGVPEFVFNEASRLHDLVVVELQKELKDE